MAVYDISQEIFSCRIFPGDPSPEYTRLQQIAMGDICNLTEFRMCAHNGTHVDAPKHFIETGKTIDQIAPDRFVGPCYVASHNGNVTAWDAKRILQAALNAEKSRCEYISCSERILIAGNAVVTEAAARIFADRRLKLIGNESQTVGPFDSPAAVHRILLGAEVILLEGICLENIPEGVYFLCAQPLNLGDAEGAPCRAILLDIPLNSD